MKRILTIQDFSCFGKCSLTAALPVISAMGIECAAVPTAMLSAHTFFPDFVCCDLSDQIAPIAKHFSQLAIGFDAIYTGFLASPEQIEQVLGLIDMLAEDRTLLLVDPAFGDHGQLYSGLSDAMPAAMAKLCARADVIVPNWTEGCLLTGTPYVPQPTPEQAEDMLGRLLLLGAKQVLLTGLEYDDQICVEGRSTAQRFTLRQPRLDNNRPGTGDLFASVCAGALTLGASLSDAARMAADFVSDSIHATLASHDPRPYATDFETALPRLCRAAALIRSAQKGEIL